MSETIFDMTRQNLEHKCASLGVSGVHAKNLFRKLYKSLDSKPWSAEGFPKNLSSAFDSPLETSPIEIFSEHQSTYDNSVKFVVKLQDGQKVEMVLMPESNRITLCVSSQVGCAQGCTFCHTGRMGLLRNLSTAEIVGQVWTANKWISEHPQWLELSRLPHLKRITNIVFMGMGEPLDNVENVASAITILTDPYGAHIAKRRISVSTAGHLDGLDRLIELHPDVMLAISVHSADNLERSKIMPINRKWPLADLFAKLRNLPQQQERGLLLQYTLIRGVNDSIEHAKKLIDLCNGLNVKINIIPLNEIDPSRFLSPTTESLDAFRDEIYKSGIRVLVRYSKGQDIAAACGQLVIKSDKSRPSPLSS